MKGINSSGLPGRFKLWIYQHGVLQRLSWPFTVYNIPMTEIEKMEVTLNKHIKQWLGVPKSFSSVGLYSTSSKLQLPLKSVTDEYKTTKARQTMTIRNNADPFVREAGINLTSGRKWNVDTAVNEAQARLRQKDIIGSLCYFLSTSDLPVPNNKTKRDFGTKLGQILTFDLSLRGLICKIKKICYRLVPRVKFLDCANFCPHRSCWIPTPCQNVIFVVKLGQICVRLNLKI